MAKTVVGLFDRMDQARAAVTDLERMGVDRDDVSIVASNQKGETTTRTGHGEETKAGEGAAAGATTGAVAGGAAGLMASLAGLTIPVIGPVLAAGPIVATLTGAGVGAATGGVVGGLVGAGIPEDEAKHYQEGVKRGGTLVIVRSDDVRADQVADALSRAGAVDIDERVSSWSQSGYATAQVARTTTQTTQAARPQAQNVQGQQAIPVVEEELQVGKRQVQRGGVRVYSHVTEKPVEESVRLREEHVNVERRPVDRPATNADFTHKGEAIEMRETAEVPVVSKTARVVEEVVVNKDVRERTEQVRDTVRRKDVEVERVGESQPGEATGFTAYATDFRNDFTTNYGTSGATYEQYEPIYRHGYELGADQRYSSKDWDALEPEFRKNWEQRNPGTWERFKNAAKYGWQRARTKASQATR